MSDAAASATAYVRLCQHVQNADTSSICDGCPLGTICPNPLATTFGATKLTTPQSQATKKLESASKLHEEPNILAANFLKKSCHGSFSLSKILTP